MVKRAYIHLELENQAWINARAAWIIREFGRQFLCNLPIITPDDLLLRQLQNANEEELIATFDRVAQSIGLDPNEIGFWIGDAHVDAHGKRNLGLYYPVENGHVVEVQRILLDRPPVLLSVLVHELCHVHLLGHQRVTDDQADHEPLTDLLGVFLGYGILQGNSVVHELTWAEQFHMDPSVQLAGKQGYMTMAMFGYALALLARWRKDDGESWKPYMRADVKDAFSKSMRYFDREGLPDLSVVPNEFPMPIIEARDSTTTTTTQPADTVRQRPAYHADEVEVEQPPEEIDYAADQAVEDDDDQPRCVYCGAILDSSFSEEICPECQESIDQGEAEYASQRETRDESDEAVAKFMKVVMLGLAVFLVIFVVGSILSWFITE